MPALGFGYSSDLVLCGICTVGIMYELICNYEDITAKFRIIQGQWKRTWRHYSLDLRNVHVTQRDFTQSPRRIPFFMHGTIISGWVFYILRSVCMPHPKILQKTMSKLSNRSSTQGPQKGKSDATPQSGSSSRLTGWHGLQIQYDGSDNGNNKTLNPK